MLSDCLFTVEPLARLKAPGVTVLVVSSFGPELRSGWIERSFVADIHNAQRMGSND